jgi:TetR/AcrR family transcriptional repressor of nem operon
MSRACRPSISDAIDAEIANDPDPVRVWAKVFRGTAFSDHRMCPCAVLGAGAQDLPEETAREVKAFFRMCHDKMIAQGLSSSKAAEVLGDAARCAGPGQRARQ